MKFIRPLHISRRQSICIAVAAFTIGAYLLSLPLPPFRNENAAKSVVWIECRYCYALHAPGCDTVFFNTVAGDSLLQGLSPTRKEAERTQWGQGCWYSSLIPIHFSRGNILTTSSVARPDTVMEQLEQDAAKLAGNALRQIEQQLGNVTQLDDRLVYYMSTHNVQDEGYTHIAQYEDLYKATKKRLEKAQKILEKTVMSSAPQVSFMATYACRHITREGRLSATETPCRRIKTDRNGLVTLQTTDKTMPDGTASLGYPLVNGMLFTSARHPMQVWLAGFNLPFRPDTITGLKPDRIEGRAWKTDKRQNYATSLALQKSARGVPIVNSRGVLVGLADGCAIIPVR
ncbi:MAG TPA: hypothetical protein DEQ84_07525 [Prevotellaceae bacterium]|nr:hypothetical protein [Prevotellaceae bacterium]